MFWELCHVWYTELVTYPFHINSVSVDNQFQSSSRSFEYDHEEFGSISWFRIFRYPRDHPNPKPNDKETMVTASETSGNSASKHFDTRHPLWWCYHRGSQPYTELDHRDEFSRIRQKIDIITQMFSIFRFSAKCVFFSSVFQLMNRYPLLTNGR